MDTIRRFWSAVAAPYRTARKEISVDVAVVDCRAVLFDLDGVLVDSLPQITALLRAWAGEHGLDPEEVIALSHGRTDADVVRLAAPRLDPVAEVAAIQTREVAAAREVRAMPGSRTLVGALTAAGIPWAVVTSGCAAVARARLDSGHFPPPQVLLTAEDVTSGKPDPEGYLAAADRLGCAPHECLVVEDAPAGVAAARAGGIPVLGVVGTVEARFLATNLLVDTLASITVRPGGGLAIRS